MDSGHISTGHISTGQWTLDISLLDSGQWSTVPARKNVTPLSTVNCQLSPSNTPQLSQEIFPGSLHSVCQSISGKILFSGTIFLAQDLHQFHDISWQKFSVMKFWMKILKNFFQNFPHDLLTFYHENSKSQSLVTCHLSPVITCQSPVIWTGHKSLGRRIQNLRKFVCARFGKSLINPVSVVQFSNFQRILGGNYLLHDRKF